MDGPTGWSPPALADASFASSTCEIAPPDAKHARIDEVPAMAAITAGTMRPDPGVSTTKVVVPISWMAQHDVSVTSIPAVRPPSEDVSIEAAEMELAQAQAEAANAKARAAEAKLHLIRAHKSQDSGNNSASGVSSSHPSALVDLSQELSHIMDEGEMQSPNT